MGARFRSDEDRSQRVDAVTVEDVRKTAAAMLSIAPTVAAIGAIGKAPGQADIAARLRGV